MNSKVHPLVVALVMILTFVALAMWMWGRAEASLIGGPAELRLDRDGHLYIQIQDRLIEHDATGEYVETHDLAAIGVEQFLGSFAFFSNGDVLLRRGPDPRSFYDNIRALQRKTNQTSLQPLTPESGLYRCRLRSQDCNRFGHTGIDLKATHGIFIDWQSDDDVYISDTSRHLLRKYSRDGVALSEPLGGFKFPNQLLIDDGQLYVADTNNHRVRVIDPQSNAFGGELASHNVTPEVAVREHQRWPSHLARVGDEWWVNNMRSGMNEGGIYIFDNSWQFDRKATLPPDADPIAVLAFRDEVLVTDWKNDRVHRLSSSGDFLGLFQSPGLAKVLEDSKFARARFEYLSYSGVFLLALVFGGLMVRALVVTVSPDATKPALKEAPVVPTSTAPLYLAPTPKVVARAKYAILFVAVLLVTAALVVAQLLWSHEFSSEIGEKLLLPGGAIIVVFVLIAWVSRANTHSAIQLEGELLTLRDNSGRQSSCSLQNASYTNNFVATRDMAVFLGQTQARLFDREALDQQLFPRLSKAQKFSAWQMQLFLIRLRHPQGIMTVLTIAGLAIYAAWAMFRRGF